MRCPSHIEQVFDMSSIGILAYGSLIDDPGEEIVPLIQKFMNES